MISGRVYQCAARAASHSMTLPSRLEKNMTRNPHLAFLLAAMLGTACLAVAQDQTHPAATSTTDKSSSKNATPAQDSKPSADDATPPKKSGASDNPFPEEQSKEAAKAAEQGGTPPIPADMEGDPTPAPREGDGRASDSSADEGVSSSRTRLEGMNDTDPDAARPQKTTITSVAHNPKLAKEDVAIGKMYMQSENYKGANIRYKEALALDPDSADAAFGIAESARKMNQAQEAIANYQLCLDLDPSGPRSKASRKALSQLQSAQSQ
jgi:tetratricopeptide (TPR) repeat protein